MRDQLRDLAIEILRTFSLPIAQYAGERVVEAMKQFAAGLPEPEVTFRVDFAGASFQTNKATFLRHELPKTLNYLASLPPEARNSRLQAAMQAAGSDPEQIVIRLIQNAQQERRGTSEG